MPQSLEITFGLAGVVLLAAGIIGGGFKMIQIDIPPLGRYARLLATLVGAALIGTAVWAHEPRGAPAASSDECAKGICFAVVDRLWDHQISDEIDVYIDDRHVGTLRVDKQQRSTKLSVAVPKAGQYSYRLSGTTVYEQNGKEVPITGTGQGVITVTPNNAFDVVWDQTAAGEYQCKLK